MSPLGAPAGDPILRRLLLVSAALHVVAFLTVAVLGSLAPARPPIEQDAIKTRLVRLGKKRDKKLLPRIVKKRPPPPPRKQPVVKPVDQKPPPPDKTAKEVAPPPPPRSAQDILKEFSEKNDDPPDLSALIAKRVHDDEEEGDPEGAKIGEEISGRLKATYNDRLLARVQGALFPPSTLSDEERLRLRARLFLAVGPGGELLSARIAKPSGNSAFDNAILAAAKKAAPYPAPPIVARKFYAAGVQMNVCPTSCQ